MDLASAFCFFTLFIVFVFIWTMCEEHTHYEDIGFWYSIIIAILGTIVLTTYGLI